MRLCLLLLSLVLLSCGKENKIGEIRSLPSYEQKSFIEVPHNEGENVLRNKILNHIVELEFPAKQSLHQISNHDELMNFTIDEKDFKNYEQKEKMMAKVIVSFHERLEIYFLPEGIPLVDLVKVLQLETEGERVFKLLATDALKTYPGAIFYLVNLNHSDLMKNDKKFFEENLFLQGNFSNRIISFKYEQLVEIRVRYNYFVETQTTRKGTGRAATCSRDMIEAGSCGGCTYLENLPSGQYEQRVESSLHDLSLIVNLNGKSTNAANLGPVKLQEGEFVIRLAADGVTKNSILSLGQEATPASVINTRLYEISPTCRGLNEYKQFSLQSRADLSVSIKIVGRGEELKVIKL